MVDDGADLGRGDEMIERRAVFASVSTTSPSSVGEYPVGCRRWAQSGAASELDGTAAASWRCWCGNRPTVVDYALHARAQ